MPEKGETDELDERLITNNMGTSNKQQCGTKHNHIMQMSTLDFLVHALIRIHLINVIRNSCFGNKAPMRIPLVIIWHQFLLYTSSASARDLLIKYKHFIIILPTWYSFYTCCLYR